MKYDYDCVVIGAGIAGMTSAIFLKRYNLNVLLLDKGFKTILVFLVLKELI